MKAHRVRSVSAFNFVNFLNFFNSQEYFAEMGFHGFGFDQHLLGRFDTDKVNGLSVNEIERIGCQVLYNKGDIIERVV